MSQATALPWQGLHHLALQTPDLNATIQFYRDVLGMQAGAIAPANDLHGRHVSIYTGGNAYLHFFENPAAQIFPPPDFTKMHWMPGAIHHLAFGIPDAAAAHVLLDLLNTLNIPSTGVMDQGDTYNLVFPDNNGMPLEANWPKLS